MRIRLSYHSRTINERILTFLAPEVEDPNGVDKLNRIQALIAVATGGISGKGWAAECRQLGYLPGSRDNDFIFAVLAEESGLLGCLLARSLLSGHLRMPKVAARHPIALEPCLPWAFPFADDACLHQRGHDHRNHSDHGSATSFLSYGVPSNLLVMLDGTERLPAQMEFR